MTSPPRAIYLDHNATTPVAPDVLDAMIPYLSNQFGNPSSNHEYGVPARQAVDRARSQVAQLVGCEPEGVVFTSGGTEANNLAIVGTTSELPGRRHIITSVVEHPATEQPCRLLERRGWQCDRVAVDAAGRVDPEAVERTLRSDTALVTIMHANNETGSVQPLAALSQAVKASGALLHTDAAQSVGKLTVNLAELGVDLVSIAGHKLYAPKGVGALCARSGVPLAPILVGAGHEWGIRPGTENVASIVGLGAACTMAARDLASEQARLRGLRDSLYDGLRERGCAVALNGHPAERLPNTLNLRFDGVRGSALLQRAPEVAASTGSACHDAAEQPSAVLVAMGLSAEQALGAVRLSLGRSTTRRDVERTVEALTRGYRELTAA